MFTDPVPKGTADEVIALAGLLLTFKGEFSKTQCLIPLDELGLVIQFYVADQIYAIPKTDKVNQDGHCLQLSHLFCKFSLSILN